MKLARTGLEQPYMRDRPKFIEVHREFERVANVNVSKHGLTFIAKTIDRAKFYYNC